VTVIKALTVAPVREFSGRVTLRLDTTKTGASSASIIVIV